MAATGLDRPDDSPRVVRLEIEGFRGIPSRLDVDFRNPAGKPVSLLVSGDNGTGKSSIVDALEFALQGHVRGRWLPSGSLAGPQDTAVTVELSGHSSLRRDGTRSAGGARRNDVVPHDRFRIAPFVLRRGDITRFWETQEHERLLMFDSFLRGRGAEMQRASVQIVLSSLGAVITDSFRKLSPTSEPVRRIELLHRQPTTTTLAFNVHLSNGESVPPQQIFSEANLDLLALLVYLAFVEEAARRGQAKLLVLDDTLQSIDAPVRRCLSDHIVARFHDWQLIITAHDRLWLEQLRVLMRQHAHDYLELAIVRWSFDDGPVVVGGDYECDQALTEALDRGRITDICAHAGLLLERVCHELSYALPISVTRRTDERYTLGDLWPGVFKALLKTTSRAAAEDVQRWVHLRNLAGAHYNAWAQGLSGHEARQFGEAVLNLVAKVRCRDCHRWVVRMDGAEGGREMWVCRCGATHMERSTG